jgi:nucleotide-binding universal stress UspA family protein
MRGRIVVGVDGSASAAAALAWAASEARLRGVELVACSVVERHPDRHHDVSDSVAMLAPEESADGYPTTVLTRYGEPRAELLAVSDDADLLVVGTRGRGRLAGSLSGSVSRACATHARCPVVVVGQPSPTLPAGRVVVGVDGSVHARAALLVAAEEARLRGATLQVLHAVYWDNIGTELITPTPKQLLEWGHKLVDAELAETRVNGESTIVTGHPGEVLVQHSGSADLLVLGSRGHNHAVSLLLGSISEHCVRHARCPVLVTRADRRHRDDEAQATPTEART